MDVASSSIYSPLLPSFSGRRRSTYSDPSTSSFLLCAYKGLHIGRVPTKQVILKGFTSALNYVAYVPRMHGRVSSHDCLQDELTQLHFDYKRHRQSKLLKRTIVRCELAGTGISGSAYPLSEIKLASKVRGACFYAVTAVVAICLIVVMFVQHPFVLMLDRYQRKAHYFIAKTWATLTVSPFIKIEFEGLELLPPHYSPAVYVSNHQSFLDIYTLLTLGRSFKFISKTGIFLIPFIGWAMSMLGVIPLKRMDSRSQLECLRRCMDQIKKGASVFFFPEGTRSKDGKLGAFKKGAFSVAAKTGVPVVPMTLIGTGKIMPAGMEGIVNPGSIKVVIHKPIEGSDPEVLCDEARDTIAATLDRQS